MMRKVFLSSFFSALLCFFLLCLFVILSVAFSNLRFYAFSDPHCQSCVNSLQPLLNMYGDKVVIYDVRESHNADRFFKIINLIGLETSIMPLIGVFKNGSLTAIVAGYYSEKSWKTIVEAEYEGVPVYTMEKITPFKIIEEQNVTNLVANLFADSPINKTISNKNVYGNIFYLLPLIITAAAVDAINPCAFYVLIVFLSLVFFRSGKKAVLKTGIAFSTAIFIMYYLMGAGLLQVFTYVKEAKILVAILGFSMGLRGILNFIFGVFGLSMGIRDVIGSFLKRKFKRIPIFLSKKVSSYLRKVSENPLTAFLIGVAVSVFLLPCTSGPYFIALSLIADLKHLSEGLLFLALYNIIIVMPFLVITLSIYALKLKTAQLKKWSIREQRWINLMTGLLMILLTLYLLFTSTF